MPAAPEHGAPVPSATPERGAEQAPHRSSQAPQSWSFALFAVLTTVAIIIVALSAPVLFDHLVVPIWQSLGLPGELKGATERAWGHILSFQLAVIALTVLMAGVAPGRGPSLGWQAPAGRLSWLKPFVVTVVVSIITAFVAFTYFSDIVAQDLKPIRQMIDGAPLWLAFVALAIGAPLSEELLFRGFLLHRLRQTRIGFWGGAIIANVGWALLHFQYSWLGLADVFLAGLLFSWALWRTGSIWVPISFHALYNATVFAILLIPSTQTWVPALW